MIHYWQSSTLIRDGIYIPKYYNPELVEKQASLADTHYCQSIGSLVKAGLMSAETGHEIGKAAYGTGDIPFVRTSDISNWEIKSAPKPRQAVRTGRRAADRLHLPPRHAQHASCIVFRTEWFYPN